jgi:peptidoglycan/LPS O-acetylase OafA/YrhL
MEAISPFPALVCLLVALGVMHFLAEKSDALVTLGRIDSLDGLRGYASFLVFMHHACVWYYYMRSGMWVVPSSNLYTHFGQSSVAIFFMTTGHLFFKKVVNNQTRPIDWGRLYVSRLLRLTPVYLFMLILVLAIVWRMSNGEIHESKWKLASELVHWFAFTILGGPDINNVEHTYVVVAGVTWSLAYEWLFYLSLPAIALLAGVVPPALYLVLGAVSILWLATLAPELYHLAAFLCGMLSSLIIRSRWLRGIAASKICSLMVIACFAITVAAFPTAHDVIPLLLLAMAFTLIAAGNGVFGILTMPASKALGDLSYSLYLLHGIVLYVFFKLVIGLNDAKQLSATGHWLIILIMTLVLITLCTATYRAIERPAMNSTDSVVDWIRKKRRRSSPANSIVYQEDA